MPQYFSPGVYVEEVPSAIKAIAGVGTSTAGFVGIVPDIVSQPLSRVTDRLIGKGETNKKEFELVDSYPVQTTSFRSRVNGAVSNDASLSNDTATKKSKVTFTTAPAVNAEIKGDYNPAIEAAAAGESRLCTNFGEFKKSFGDFTGETNHDNLAHAAYGFFNNGGTRCWVVRAAPGANQDENNAKLINALNFFKPIDEIAIVAIPGATADAVQNAILDHCEDTYLQDRFAILDGRRPTANFTKANIQAGTRDSDYGAIYFPWIKAFNPMDGKTAVIPPCGHIAGIYARVDTERGVHKAPANEVIRGALGVEVALGKAEQAGLNPEDINVIRQFDGNSTVWGARTLAGKEKADLKYINVRRTLLFLRESIDEGTQWVVFEPNTPTLWQKITRNVSAFLTVVWRGGALFGNTPQEAFYVKCDAETNPPELRELGQVVTEIGVAIARPAEFVIFRISQWAGPGK